MASTPKTLKTSVMRSQLGRARGLGSAKSGPASLKAERISAIALVPLTVWFVIAVIGQLGAPLPVVAAWAGSPVNAALLLALIVMTFQHTAMGLQVVYEDYIHTTALREAVVLLTNGACLLLGLMASVAVLKLVVAAH